MTKKKPARNTEINASQAKQSAVDTRKRVAKDAKKLAKKFIKNRLQQELVTAAAKGMFSTSIPLSPNGENTRLLAEKHKADPMVIYTMFRALVLAELTELGFRYAIHPDLSCKDDDRRELITIEY